MLLGLHGKAGSGKDQSYEYISDWAAKQGRPARRDAFADRLKLSAAKALGYHGAPHQCIAICNQLKQPGWEIIVREPRGTVEHVISGREYLQLYGTEAHREVFGTDFWVDAVMASYNQFDPLSPIFVVTDVRFPNEAEAIHTHGGEVWHLLRPRHVILEGAHPSEQPLPADQIDYVVINDGDLDHLRGLVEFRLGQLVCT